MAGGHEDGEDRPEAQDLAGGDLLIGTASWFCVLTGDTADTDDGAAGAPDEDEREGKDEADLCRDVLVGASVERLCAIACVNEKGVTALDVGEQRTETVDLSGPRKTADDLNKLLPRREQPGAGARRCEPERARVAAGLDTGSRSLP